MTTGTARSLPDARATPPAYVGRFAPSPSGALHLGSLYTAVASHLEARAARGRWLVRLEDLDHPRVVPGAADDILRTLHDFGFEWDGEVVRQSERKALYADALDELARQHATYECSCTRSQLADEPRYPGHCRSGPCDPSALRAIRLRIEPGTLQFADGIQGVFRQDVARVSGDFILKRRDQIYAYVLASVVDDAEQGVTHIVRGADLLDDTPRQIALQRRLNLSPPGYAHVPLLMESDGSKLAKSARSIRIHPDRAPPLLVTVFNLLGLAPGPDMAHASVAELWRWAIPRWDLARVPKRLRLLTSVEG